MIDLIEELCADGEWMRRFCADCPAIRSIPATVETPAEYDCPADREPFRCSGCIRGQSIDEIEEAVAAFEYAVLRAAPVVKEAWTAGGWDCEGGLK